MQPSCPRSEVTRIVINGKCTFRSGAPQGRRLGRVGAIPRDETTPRERPFGVNGKAHASMSFTDRSTLKTYTAQSEARAAKSPSRPRLPTPAPHTVVPYRDECPGRLALALVASALDGLVDRRMRRTIAPRRQNLAQGRDPAGMPKTGRAASVSPPCRRPAQPCHAVVAPGHRASVAPPGSARMRDPDGRKCPVGDSRSRARSSGNAVWRRASP